MKDSHDLAYEDEIRRLVAEVERLRALLLDKAGSVPLVDHAVMRARLETVERERDEALAETERLREALQEIATLGRTDGPAAPLLVRAGDIATRLLELRGTTAQGGDAEALIDQALANHAVRDAE